MGFALALMALSLTALIVSACGRGGYRPGVNLSKRIIPLGQPVPKGGGVYKVGQPYQIEGRWYYPREDPGYDRVGVASWYGEMFHGRNTANGEIYDMSALTAAHPTLPLPVYARVTNLRNGRSLVVRVNDRGPYAHDRIIDMSKLSAELLDFRKNGTTQVRVQYLSRAPLNGDDTYERQVLAGQRWARIGALVGPGRSSQVPYWIPLAEKATDVQTKAVPSVTSRIAKARKQANMRSRRTAFAIAPYRSVAVPADGSVTTSGEGGGDAPPISYPTITSSIPRSARIVENRYRRAATEREIFVQPGAFKIGSNAERLATKLAAIGQTKIAPVTIGGTLYHRVRLGPFKQRELANAMLKRVVEAGVNGASIAPY